MVGREPSAIKSLAMPVARSMDSAKMARAFVAKAGTEGTARCVSFQKKKKQTSKQKKRISPRTRLTYQFSSWLVPKK